MSQDMSKYLKEKKEEVELAKSLERLGKNRDFKKVILTSYLEQEAIRCVAVKAMPSMQKPEHQQSLDNKIIAIGQLSEYFRAINIRANLALKDIKEATELPELEDGEEYEIDDGEK